MPNSLTLRTVALLAALLAIPVALNLAFGSRLGVWWAPFPAWLLVASFSWPVALILPSAVFLGVAIPFVRNGHQPNATMVAVVGALVIHTWWWVNLFLKGPRGGQSFAITVLSLGTTLLVVALGLSILAVCSKRIEHGVLSIWFVCLWFAWYSVPWLLEAM